MIDIALADMRLTAAGAGSPIDGESHRRIDGLTATVESFTVASPTWEIVVALQHWSNGDDDVRLLDRGDAPQLFDRLRTNCRMGILRAGQGLRYVELGQARVGNGDQPALRKVTLHELDAGARCDVAETLTALGAAAVGTRQAALGETNNRRGRLCAVFPEANMTVAVAAYALTRLAPLNKRLPA